jgi:hypothetical protein
MPLKIEGSGPKKVRLVEEVPQTHVALLKSSHLNTYTFQLSPTPCMA